ncbi:hypothetical protein ACJRPK_14045 [Aquimarina sp. 2-A2]|uniref:hypothetical protein n=1 Tax=Aquimarina sp. 2-A2 TaxID=3382644 RepID=UPI00387F03DA
MSTTIKINDNGEILVNGKIYNQETIAGKFTFTEIKHVTRFIESSKNLPGYKEVVNRVFKKGA